jgi:hypothetical protein
MIEMRPFRWFNKPIVRVLFVLLLLTIGIAVDFFVYPLLPAGGHPLNRGENGSWLRDTWYFGTETEPFENVFASVIGSRPMRGKGRKKP